MNFKSGEQRVLERDLKSRKYEERVIEDKRDKNRYDWLADYDDDCS